MKFLKGPNRFRILTSPTLGWVTWVDNEDGSRQPIREAFSKTRPNSDAKHFWAMGVLDFADDTVKILEITQVGIIDAITALATDPDWGNPKEYNLTVTRKGEGKDTKYTVTSAPHKELSDEQRAIVADVMLDVPALLRGESPFVEEMSESDFLG